MTRRRIRSSNEYRTTSGADLEHDFSPSADANYYVRVSPFRGTGTYFGNETPIS